MFSFAVGDIFVPALQRARAPKDVKFLIILSFVHSYVKRPDPVCLIFFEDPETCQTFFRLTPVPITKFVYHHENVRPNGFHLYYWQRLV